ncbi:MAG: glycosyltransferase family 4 protein [Gemmatimonadetes bacterium]|nr:glycosyltransferase family 4 protein [Gemmatimonadota bacterium]
MGLHFECQATKSQGMSMQSVYVATFPGTMRPRSESSDRPRLLYILTRPLFAQRFLKGQLAFLRERGYDITVVASPEPELAVVAAQEQVTVIPIRIPRDIQPLADVWALLRLIWLCLRLRPDIVNASMPKAALLGLLAARLTGVPVRIYVLRGLRSETTRGLKRWILGLTEWLSSACAHRVVSVSHSLRDRYIAQDHAPADRVTVIGHGSSNGVDAARFEAGASDRAVVQSLRRSLGITADQQIIGFVGRLTQDKGLVDLYQAFLLVRARLPDVRLLLVGDFETGSRDLPDEVRRAVIDDEAVIVTGVVAEPAPYYGLMDMVALASHREGFPNLPLEAGACAIPVVGVRATGTVDAIVDGETGLLADVGDWQGLADHIIRYLEDPQLRQRHGTAGQRRVRESFAGQMIWNELEQTYRDLLELRASG